MRKHDNLRGLLPNRPRLHKDELAGPGGVLSNDDMDSMLSSTKALFDQVSCLDRAPATVAAKIERFAMIRGLKGLAKLVDKLLNKSQAQLGYELMDEIEKWGMSSVSTEKYTCFLEQAIYPTVEDKDTLDKWLKQSGQDSLRSVHSSTLRSLAATHLEEGKGPIPGVKVYFDEQARVRRK